MHINFHFDNGNITTLKINDNKEYEHFTEWLEGNRGAYFEHDCNNVKTLIRKEKVCMIEVIK